MKCKKCGAELEAAVKFCPQCGEKVKLYCTECGEELTGGGKFCPSCGKPVIGNISGEIKELKKNEPMEEDKLAIGTNGKEDETDTDVKGEAAVLGTQGNEESKATDSNDYEQKQEAEEKFFVSQSKEEFLEELMQLASRDADSKRVLDYYDTKIFTKHVYPYLNQKEKIVALRHIVHHNFASVMIRNGSFYVKEFLVLTNERVIKFVQSYWLKPKIKSCYLSEISSTEATRPGNALKGVFWGEQLRIKTSEKTIKLHTFGKGSAQKIEREIFRIIPDKKENPAEARNMAAAEKNMVETVTSEAGGSVKEEKNVKRERIKIGFKIALLIAFASFFLPFCTVSCGSETIISSSGYELAGDLGMTEDEMELYELTPEDTMNKVVVLILTIMAAAWVATEAKTVIGMSCLTGVAALLLQSISLSSKWNDIKEIGCQVKFEFGYWLALIMLLLATAAFLWSPGVIKKIEKALVWDKGDDIKLRKTINEGLSAAIFLVMLVAVVTNWTSVKSWGAAFRPKEVPDLRDDYMAGLKDTDGDYFFGIDDTYEREGSFSNTDVEQKIEPYEGTWWDLNSQRCYMDIIKISDELLITINWGSGAFDSAEWSMTGTYDSKSDKIQFNDCTLTYIHYNDDGSSNEDVQYTDGTGAIYIADDGYLYWEDDKEQMGSGCYFEKDTNDMEFTYYQGDESEYILPESSSRYLTFDDLAGLDKATLRLARNEIYAKHGRMYETDDLREYFSSKSWYYGYLSADEFDDSVLNEYEKANLDLIKAAEGTGTSSNVSWTGTYIAEDDQAITVSSADDFGVVLTFVGYSEEGWRTDTKVLSYRDSEKTQVSDPYYYDGALVQEVVYSITETGIQVETLPSGGWADGFYLRQ